MRHSIFLLLAMASSAAAVSGADRTGAAPALHEAPAPSHAAGALGHYAPKPEFDARVSASRYLEMRDGVRLAVRIDRPARNGVAAPGRFPVLVQFGLSIDERANPKTGAASNGFAAVPSLTDHGYVVIQVARRGNGQSFGVMRGYHQRDEAYDAYEVVEWAARQEWSDGKVGTYGCSNTGDAALQAATTVPPHLKAVFAGCFNWDKYDGMRRGGIVAQWGTAASSTVERDMRRTPVDGDSDRTLLLAAAHEHQKAADMGELWAGMPFRDSWSPLVTTQFWAETSLRTYAAQMRQAGVALYLQTGWRNESRDQSFVTWANMPGARLIVGPWEHCLNNDFNLLSTIHQFFDEHLKGVDTGLSREQPIRYFVMNAPAGRQWRQSRTWPVADSHRETLLLTGKALLGSTARPSARAFVASPDDDVDCPQDVSGGRLQPCHLPRIGMAYRGEALAHDRAIIGSPVAHLLLRTDRPDANLFVFLEDVAPDGRVVQITEGRLKASLRKTDRPDYRFEAEVPWHRAYEQDSKPMVAGTEDWLDIGLTPTAYVLKAGHRLQFSVRGMDFRERNREAGMLPVRIEILGGPGRSALSIPWSEEPA